MFELPFAGLALVGVNAIADTANDITSSYHNIVDLGYKSNTLNYQKYRLSNAMTQNYLGTSSLVSIKKNGLLNLGMNQKTVNEQLLYALLNSKQIK